MNNQQRILDISKRLGLAHIGSCISVLPILEEIYEKKKPEDIVLMDNAHAHLAHLVVALSYVPLELKQDEISAENLIKRYGIHCDKRAGCDASGGSLGHALGIGIGYALADPTRDVYVIVSDGSLMEGSNWEGLRIINKLRLKNVHIYCNFNGYTAVNKIDTDQLGMWVKMFNLNAEIRHTTNGEGLEGIAGHYITIPNEEKAANSV